MQKAAKECINGTSRVGCHDACVTTVPETGRLAEVQSVL